MRQHTTKKYALYILCALFFFTCTGTAGVASAKSVLFTVTATTGPDAIPYSVSVIKCFVDPQSWIDSSYPADEASPVHIIRDSVQLLNVQNRTAIAFKTWEHENYVQNLLVDEGGFFLLYTTPHGTFNPDGNRVFQSVLQITIPGSGGTLEDENDKLDSVESWAEATESNVKISSSSSSFGTKVGSYNGVNAYSNGSVGYYSNVSNYYNGYRTGIEWQCVEYVDRYYKTIYNKNITGGNANTYYSDASSKGLNRAANGSTDKPRPGNILCSAGAKGNYGHVAIIREVGSDYIKVIQQNWSNNSSDNSKKLSMTYKNGKYTVAAFGSGYAVQGWCWPR